MLRLLVALPISGCLAIALFSLMAWLVNAPKQTQQHSIEVTKVSYLVSERENEAQTRSRSLPPEPKVIPAQAPQTFVDLPQTLSIPSMDAPVDAGALGLNINIGAVDVQAPQIAQISGSQQAMPLYRVDPNYPAKARKRRAEGFVIIKFNIDPQGKPVDLEIIDANPKRLFEQEAIKALKQWRYQPKLEFGKAVVQHGQTVKLEFRQPK